MGDVRGHYPIATIPDGGKELISKEREGGEEGSQSFIPISVVEPNVHRLTIPYDPPATLMNMVG